MRAIIIVMLAVQAAIFLVTVLATLYKRTETGGRPIWFTLGFSLIIVSGTSWRIGDRHFGEPGVELLLYASALLMGMGLMAMLLMIRRRLELNART